MSEEHLIEPVVRLPGDRPAGQPCPSRPAEVREAVLRAVAERCLATRTPCDTDALADALLVASELTTNAILHGGGVTGFEVDVDVDGPGVRLSVSDRSDALPVAVPAAGEGRRRPGGHGWPIVCRLARDVRVSDLPAGGKRITALVPLV
ncbi:ATP-binding protein [Streptomyces sp. DH-12]|uniref:ATP-binding protein n=1 Tax=unclassified Streptomyces TaxID=2593676 RepID=UPI000CCF3261|nr:ATP-binding protein [Streptomyces sp. DH-12]PNV36012.1 ATP-binding protein [Streptomyces sp. DH-12]